ncbi:MAG TPA: ASKHA domain-containing protein [Methanoregulaceae archaeon]|nr:ASKHA domain-containing protein [Methanoregulaceae archaeon]
MGRIIIMPGGEEFPLREGESLLRHLQEMGMHITARCGGTGECGSCRIGVLSGNGLSSPTRAEKEVFNTEKERLACQAFVINGDDDIVIELHEPPGFSILETGLKTTFLWDPPTMVWITSSGKVAMRDGKEIATIDGRCAAVALDIGTTTVVARWYDLEKINSSPIASFSMLNPQVRFGDNIIDRISHAMAYPGGQLDLEHVILGAVNQMLESGPVKPSEIYEIVVVGNTVMRDLFAGFPVKSLGRAPYEPFSPGPVRRKARERGIRGHHLADVYIPPVLGHFVGADMLAVLLAVGMHNSSGISMAIDIGTNTEIAIGNREGILVTSCASGPAFEGSGVSCGIGAVEGAIAEVGINRDESVTYLTIGGKDPLGICGSGLVDALAGMLRYGIIDAGGKLSGGRERFVIADRSSLNSSPVFLDGEDIDAVKLAKSAIYAGTQILIEASGVKIHDISSFFIAGAFGNSISPEHAAAIGLIPTFAPGQVIRAGNAAIEGASQMLLSVEKRKEAEEIVRITRHISLENSPDFEDLYIRGLVLEPYKM